MRDDLSLFELTISTGDLLITPYATKSVERDYCSKKAQNVTIDY